MKKEIKRVSLFYSSLFGYVRTIENENGEGMFCLNDVYKRLGIEKPSNIINDLKKSIINSRVCSKSNSLLNKLLPDYQQVTDKQHSLLNTGCTENQQVIIEGGSFMDKDRKHVISVFCGNVRIIFISERVLCRCICKSRKKDAWIFNIEELRNCVTGIRYMSNIDYEVNIFGNRGDDPFAEYYDNNRYK